MFPRLVPSEEGKGGRHYGQQRWSELLINDKWVKATPAFDRKMCAENDIILVEFNGRDDAVLHQKNKKDKLHIEYIKHHGSFSDLPFDKIIKAFKEVYAQNRPDLLIP